MTEPVTTPEPASSQVPRWMKITLVVSLAANLLVVGAVAGAVLTKGGKPDARHGGPRGAIANTISDALPKDTRRALGREIRQALRANPEYQDMLYAEIDALSDLMRASDYTTEALEAQLLKIQSQMMGPISLVRDLLAARFDDFTPEERAAYAERLETLLQDVPR